MNDDSPRIGVFVCECGMNIAGFVDCEAVRQYAEGLDGVTVAARNRYTCSDPGQEEIKRLIREHNLDRVVVASCSPRLHKPTFRNCIAEEGLNAEIVRLGITEGQFSKAGPRTDIRAYYKIDNSGIVETARRMLADNPS